MFLRLTHGRFDPANEADIMTRIKPVVDAFSQLPGFQTYAGAMNRELGLFVSMTYWDTQEHANFDRALLGDSIAAFTGDGGVTLEPSKIYEVIDNENEGST